MAASTFIARSAKKYWFLSKEMRKWDIFCKNLPPPPQIFCFLFYFPAGLLLCLDVSTSMTYIPGTGPQPVFPQARLLLCPAAVCKEIKP